MKSFLKFYSIFLLSKSNKIENKCLWPYIIIPKIYVVKVFLLSVLQIAIHIFVICLTISHFSFGISQAFSSSDRLVTFFHTVFCSECYYSLSKTLLDLCVFAFFVYGLTQINFSMNKISKMKVFRIAIKILFNFYVTIEWSKYFSIIHTWNRNHSSVFSSVFLAKVLNSYFHLCAIQKNILCIQHQTAKKDITWV